MFGTTRSRAVLAALTGTCVGGVLVIELWSLYGWGWWVDLVAHVLGGAAVVGWLRLERWGWDWPYLRMIAAGYRREVTVLLVAVVWEVVEVALPGFAGFFALGAGDTLADIIVTTLGGVLLDAGADEVKRLRQ